MQNGRVAARRPIVLIVLDGFGVGKDYPGNAVKLARTPNVERWTARYPYTEMAASGLDVGLPAGQMGNSEVGHLNLGAGFVVNQWITRLDQAIEDGSFFTNDTLVAAVDRARERGAAVHLLGLLGNGGVHASDNHLRAIVKLTHDRGLDRVFLHPFTDGRDTPPESGRGFVADLERYLQALGTGRIATIAGRYYAMDRDRRWERINKAYNALVQGDGPTAASAGEALERSYAAGTTDEFLVPTVVIDGGRAVATIQPGDTVIFTNFRNDRAREFTRALLDPAFDGFTRPRGPLALQYVTLVEYDPAFAHWVQVAFAPHDVTAPLASVLANSGKTQFHCAETEKYPHVTFFFNGGTEAPYEGEERTLIPSPKVATYDLQPEMSADGVAETVVKALDSARYDFIIVNFANPDMVGHTGVLAAAIAACETADRCGGDVVAATLRAGGVALVTADHGNAETMIDEETGGPFTAHTSNPVPVWLIAPEGHPLRTAQLRRGGRLADVAPTILELLGLDAPAAMTGTSLIVDQGPSGSAP